MNDYMSRHPRGRGALTPLTKCKSASGASNPTVNRARCPRRPPQPLASLANRWRPRRPEFPQAITALRHRMAQVAKCAWLTCVATRRALAATVKLGFKPVLDGKNEASTT